MLAMDQAGLSGRVMLYVSALQYKKVMLPKAGPGHGRHEAAFSNAIPDKVSECSLVCACWSAYPEPAAKPPGMLQAGWRKAPAALGQRGWDKHFGFRV